MAERVGGPPCNEFKGLAWQPAAERPIDIQCAFALVANPILVVRRLQANGRIDQP